MREIYKKKTRVENLVKFAYKLFFNESNSEHPLSKYFLILSNPSNK
jgi:hypothetical protein